MRVGDLRPGAGAFGRACAMLCAMAAALAIQLAPRAAAAAQPGAPPAPAPEATERYGVDYGLSVKKPVFAGACKACPWGQLAIVTKQALQPYGYDVLICWTCATSIGPRNMADKDDEQQQVNPASTSPFRAYIEITPKRIPDISATNESALIDAWNGRGPYAPDNKTRRNYRVVANLLSPTFYAVAVAARSGIRDIAEVKTRRGTWVVASETDPTLQLHGITKASLEANGGGLIDPGTPREIRAGADVYIGDNASLRNTWEQRMWYEVSQMDELVFLAPDPAVLDRLVAQGSTRANLPLGLLRGVDRDIPSVTRPGGTVIYLRDEAPDDFAYTLAKTLDEHRALFRVQMQPWFYDQAEVAKTVFIPLHPGARKYYVERGYLK